MTLDPVDILGETIGEPLKRLFLYFLAVVSGGWIGVMSMNIEKGKLWFFGWREFGEGFLQPLAVLFSSAGPLFIGGLLWFVFTPWRLGWFWLAAAAGSSAHALHETEPGIGWAVDAAIITGLGGCIWMLAAYRRARWASGIFVLKAENAIRNSLRNQEGESREIPERNG